jgi:hypothetical protein
MLLPAGCAAIIGALQFLGHQADQAWAEQARQSFRHTILWHLAFWEWIGSVLFFTFMVVTVLLLPEAIKASAVLRVCAQRGRFTAQRDGETRTPGG